MCSRFFYLNDPGRGTSALDQSGDASVIIVAVSIAIRLLDIGFLGVVFVRGFFFQRVLLGISLFLW